MFKKICELQILRKVLIWAYRTRIHYISRNIHRDKTNIPEWSKASQKEIIDSKLALSRISSQLEAKNKVSGNNF